jgi:hypothetical protein
LIGNEEEQMTIIRNFARTSLPIAATIAIASSMFPARAAEPIPAGRTVFTYLDRLWLAPPATIAYGYFVNIEGLPGPLFSGTPSENTAYFTWSFDTSGFLQLLNVNPNNAADPGNSNVAVLPVDHCWNIYFNPHPNQAWDNPASFSAGELIATFRSTLGTSAAAGPVFLVTQTYVLEWSRDFVYKGEAHNLASSIPYGFTIFSFNSEVPLFAATNPPFTFTGGGSAVAVGKPINE